MTQNEALFQYVTRIGDNSLILGQRLSEWCGHGPILEEDIALTNTALDLIGQATSLLKYAGEIEGKGRNEDQMAFLRYEHEYLNCLLLELPNTDYAYTLARQFLFDHFNYLMYEELLNSEDRQLAAIAEKSLKEVTYHRRRSSEWLIRLGDGTQESHERIQFAINDIWEYTGELFEADEVDQMIFEAGIGVNLAKIKTAWHKNVSEVMDAATLTKPQADFMQLGGKKGVHTEYMGCILAEMQYMQRAYPNCEW
jgi:ring-1,2-phenylacetyl-CoA epoxidase subunit PaaC